MKILLPLLIMCVCVAGGAWATEGFDDLFKLVQSGAGDEVVMAFVAASPVSYNLSVEEVLQLKEAGASSQVIRRAIGHTVSVSKTTVIYTSPVEPVRTKTVVIYRSAPPEPEIDWVAPCIGLGLWAIFDHGHHGGHRGGAHHSSGRESHGRR